MNPRSGHGMFFTLWNLSAIICGLIIGGPFIWLANNDLIEDQAVQAAVGLLMLGLWWWLVADIHRRAIARFGALAVVPLVLFLVVFLVSVLASRAGW